MSEAAYQLDPELISDFVTECTEMLDIVEPEMVSSSFINEVLANKMFRPLHSMKGVAGSLGFNNIAKVAHAAESFLSIFRSGEYQSQDEEHLGIFLHSFDFFRNVLTHVLEMGNDNDFSGEALALIERFETITKTIVKSATSDKGPAETPKEEAKVIPLRQEVMVAEESFKLEITQEMIEGFKAESLEAFEKVEQILVKINERPEEIDNGNIEDAFRLIHSFKGNCGLFSLRDLEQLGHKIESVLDLLRSKSLAGNNNIYDMVIRAIDVMREVVTSFKAGETGAIQGLDLYLELLSNVANPPGKNEKTDLPSPQTTVVEEKKSAVLSSNNGNPVAKNSLKQQDIRVNTIKLDQLNNLVGELVTARTMVMESIRSVIKENSEIVDKSLHFLGKTINDLQDITMDIRMVSISGLFNKMIRIVHDLSRKSGKKVNLSFHGEETEVDKTLLEKISDPLVHMIRNAVDHGIELPMERLKAGKIETGNITLGAIQEAGEVWIMIQDDGHGLDREKILKKARAQKMIEGTGDSLTDQEVFQMIYAPGFSTAEVVTDISGRGVGMDVVMQNIKGLKGRVTIQSKKGEGSLFTIKIPLTLAIIDGMLLKVGDVKYTLQVDSIQEIVKVNREEIRTLMESQQMIKIREDLIPVVSLSELHNHNSNKDLENGIVIIISANGNKLALLVDDLIGQQQIVVRPLPNYFKELKGISSCSILGNGEVCLIIDIGTLIDLAIHKYK